MFEKSYYHKFLLLLWKTIFNLHSNREIYIAHQNCFTVPAKHPSRILKEHVLSYVLEGEWKLSIGKEIITARKDTVFVMPAHVAHVGILCCPPNTKTMFLHFSREKGDIACEFPSSDVAAEHIYISSFVDVKNKPKIKDIFLKTINEKIKGKVIKASVYLNLLLCELSESPAYDKSQYTNAVRAKQIIHEHLYEQISNDEIARMLNVGVRTAETCFKQYYHMTIHQYIIQQKMNDAKFMLEYYPERKVVEISKELGFYDEYHFSRQFKKFTGHSPTQYRKIVMRKYSIP